jgi:hypothetical protein
VAVFCQQVVRLRLADENLTTTGTLASGALTVTGAATATTTITVASDLAIGSGSITSVSGAISFGNENLVTTGTLGAGATTVTSLLTSGDIDMGAFGNRIDLDTDNDTSIRSSADDVVTVEIGGSDQLTIKATGMGLNTTTVGSEIDDDVLGYGRDFAVNGGTSSGGVHIGATISADATNAGTLVFYNADNSDAGTATSRMIATVEGITVTSDANAGNDSGGLLVFRTKPESGAPIERMRIDSAGNVGIGEAAPLGTVHIKTADAGAIAPSAGEDDLVLENSGAVGMSIYGGTTSTGTIRWGDSTDDGLGFIRYHYSSHATLENNMQFFTAGVDRMTIDSAGAVYIGDTTNAKMTVGLTINQGTNDDEIFALKSPTDVVHGMTDLLETDTYGTLKKAVPTLGGLEVRGATEHSSQALTLLGYTGITTNTAKTTGGYGAVRIAAQEKSGTTVGAVSADGNLCSIESDGAVRFIFDVEGSAHADVEWTTYDSEDDFQLIQDIEATLVPDVFGEAVQYNADDLVRLGLFGEGSIRKEPNGKMRGMMNQTKMVMLHHGTLNKMVEAFRDLSQRLAVTEQKLLEA